MIVKSKVRCELYEGHSTQRQKKDPSKVLEASHSHTFFGSSAMSGLQSGGYHSDRNYGRYLLPYDSGDICVIEKRKKEEEMNSRSQMRREVISCL